MALKIKSGSQIIVMDGNEIDSNSDLHLNNNSEKAVHVNGKLYVKKDAVFKQNAHFDAISGSGVASFNNMWVWGNLYTIDNKRDECGWVFSSTCPAGKFMAGIQAPSIYCCKL